MDFLLAQAVARRRVLDFWQPRLDRLLGVCGVNLLEQEHFQQLKENRQLVRTLESGHRLSVTGEAVEFVKNYQFREVPEHIRQQRQLLEVLRFQQEPGQLLLEWNETVQESFLKALIEGPMPAPAGLLEQLLAAVSTSVKRRVLGSCFYYGRTELLPALMEEVCPESSYTTKHILAADILGSSSLTTAQALEMLSGLQARLDLAFRACRLIPNPELLRRVLNSLPEPLSREKWASLVTLHVQKEKLASLTVLLDDFPHMKLGELVSSSELNFYRLVQQGNQQLLDIVAARLALEMATV